MKILLYKPQFAWGVQQVIGRKGSLGFSYIFSTILSSILENNA
jgi:hypothetical protein